MGGLVTVFTERLDVGMRDGACAQRCRAAGVTERLGRGSYDHSIPLPAPRSHKTKNVFPKQES